MRTYKKGVSLVVLVITIIVLAILATTVIISISNTNIIGQANNTVNTVHAKQHEEQLTLIHEDWMLQQYFEEKTLEEYLNEIGIFKSVERNASTSYIVQFDDCGHNYIIYESGVIDNIDGKYLVTSRNKFDINSQVITDGVILSNGNIAKTGWESMGTTNFIEVSEGDNIIMSTRNKNSSEAQRTLRTVIAVCAYDENKNPISDKYVFGTSSTGGEIESYLVAEGVKYIRISAAKVVFTSDWYLQIENATTFTAYQEYFEPYYSEESPEIWENNIQKYTQIAYLPTEIYVAQGTEISIYNNQVCPTAVSGYTFSWEGSVGVATSEYNGSLVIDTSLEIGNYPVTLTINDGTSNIWSGSTVVKIVENTLDKGVSLLCLGDSLTENKSWLNSIINKSNSKISLVGTRGTSPNLHEGRSGWNSANYLEWATNASGTITNAFYNSSTEEFDWNYYKQTTGNTPDQVVIFLGRNALAEDPTANANCIKRIVDYIRKDDANIPIYLVNTLYDGAGNVTDNVSIFNLMVRTHQLLDDYENLTFVPVALTHDSVTNFEGQDDKVHPNENGFEQIANTIYI